MIELFEFIRQHWSIFMAVISFGVMVFWLVMDSKYAKKSEIKTHINEQNKRMDFMTAKIDKNDDRLSLVENRLEGLPSQQDFAELQVLMTKIEGETKATNATMKGMSHQLSLLLEEKIMNRKD